jgi:uncharacterized radical SAM superfamily Fe-S cluster-containing enzyme
MPASARDYVFFDATVSLCSTCLRRVDAKILIAGDDVFMEKRCALHGVEKVLIATDAEYYKRCRNYVKPGDLPQRFNTPTYYGCPYDCGLCPDHEQHSCIGLIEVTERCNLRCPTCYAESGPMVGKHRSLDEIERMLDALVANEGEPDVVQISGGEPTIHPKFFEILDLARTKPIRHLMVNTNGLRIGQDRRFVERLAQYKKGLEIYLQFDSFEEAPLRALRGEDLRGTRDAALMALNEHNISTTLVVTLKKGLNTHEIGRIVDFAAAQPCVRGVTFQPTQIAGRLEGFDPAKDRFTLTDVRKAILQQTALFRADDLIPVPCHPESIVMGYALKVGSKVMPLSDFFKPEDLLKTAGNTINFEQDQNLKARFFDLFSTSKTPDATASQLQAILCCLPQVAAPGLTYENVFRVVVMQFFDAYNFDIRPIKKTCIHIVQPDGRIVPFDTMNLLYRNERATYLEALKDEQRQLAAIWKETERKRLCGAARQSSASSPNESAQYPSSP